MHSEHKFAPALWDDSDPGYSPGLMWVKGKYPYWRAAKKYRDAGYSINSMRLDGEKHDGLDLERARHCRNLTREMCEWFDGQGTSRIAAGSFGHLINRYLTDAYSPLRDPNSEQTRTLYRKLCEYWQRAINEVIVADCGYEDAIRWREALRTKSDAWAKRMMGQLGRILNYGAMIEFAGASDLHNVVSRMRLKGNKPRTVAPSRAEVYRIIDEAENRGLSALALGFCLQFELALSASDVIGIWEKGEGAFTDQHGKSWKNGLTWNDISNDLLILTKGRNKTDQEAINYHIASKSPLFEMLDRVPLGARVGPVITSRNGVPYKSESYSRGFHRIVKDLGLSQYTNRDLRAAAITEAREMGASVEDNRDFAQHTNTHTTQRYMRRRDDAANRVLDLRSGAWQGQKVNRK
jgi:hypothetical protein